MKRRATLIWKPLRRTPSHKTSNGEFPATRSREVEIRLPEGRSADLFWVEQKLGRLYPLVLCAITQPSKLTTVFDPPPEKYLPTYIDYDA